MESNQWSKIRLIVTDFDGVWTDGKVIVSDKGSESVVCDRRDTLRIKEFVKRGGKLIVITQETNPVAAKRCRKMGIKCFSGCDDKWPLLQRLLESEGVRLQEVAYVGDDINDLVCLQSVGFPITVADGNPKCQAVARHVTIRRGGDGAIREILDLILDP